MADTIIIVVVGGMRQLHLKASAWHQGDDDDPNVEDVKVCTANVCLIAVTVKTLYDAILGDTWFLCFGRRFLTEGVLNECCHTQYPNFNFFFKSNFKKVCSFKKFPESKDLGRSNKRIMY